MDIDDVSQKPKIWMFDFGIRFAYGDAVECFGRTNGGAYRGDC
jgi:hypothetical protein